MAAWIIGAAIGCGPTGTAKASYADGSQSSRSGKNCIPRSRSDDAGSFTKLTSAALRVVHLLSNCMEKLVCTTSTMSTGIFPACLVTDPHPPSPMTIMPLSDDMRTIPLSPFPPPPPLPSRRPDPPPSLTPLPPPSGPPSR
jgi:hypothetical protein